MFHIFKEKWCLSENRLSTPPMYPSWDMHFYLYNYIWVEISSYLYAPDDVFVNEQVAWRTWDTFYIEKVSHRNASSDELLNLTADQTLCHRCRICIQVYCLSCEEDMEEICVPCHQVEAQSCQLHYHSFPPCNPREKSCWPEGPLRVLSNLCWNWRAAKGGSGPGWQAETRAESCQLWKRHGSCRRWRGLETRELEPDSGAERRDERLVEKLLVSERPISERLGVMCLMRMIQVVKEALFSEQ